jgi:phenylalanine-4-hydroxylase
VPRPFGVRYNPYTQSVEILDSKTQIESLMTCTSQDMQVLIEALKKI